MFKDQRGEFVGQFFRVGNYESIYLCSSVELDTNFNVKGITFFNQYRRGTLEPQTLSMDGEAMFSRVLDLETIETEYRDSLMA